MINKIAHVTLVVSEYDEAIKFYTEKLGFVVMEDTPLTIVKRWVVLQPAGALSGCQLLLARAADDEQKSRIGNQTGGRVFLFLATDDFGRDFNRFMKAGVQFVGEPRQEEYGMVAVFVDLYGNLWDLIQYK
jgi:catechol 2,3-dioxygenase-like lactoylglutathione lyase family enzyme